MPKTDKELTAEVASVFIQSWFSSRNSATLQASDVADLIKTIHYSFASLPTADSEKSAE